MTSTIQKIGRIIWMGMIVVGVLLYVLFPEYIRADAIHEFVIKYNDQAVGMYLLLSMLRCLFLIPSTPFVLSGLLLFPSQFFLVFSISLIGILFGGSVLYFFSERLGFGALIESKHPKMFALLKEKMTRYGMPIVVAWSFFPAVPTDAICCAAGLIRMNFYRFILGLAIGESILIVGYLYTGQAIWSLLFF